MTILPQTGQSEARPRAAILTELGVEPVINATGPWTRMGNASLSPRVVAAMQEISAAFVPMSELQDAVSAHDRLAIDAILMQAITSFVPGVPDIVT